MKSKAVELKPRLQKAVEKQFRNMTPKQQMEYPRKKYGHPVRERSNPQGRSIRVPRMPARPTITIQ
ncbi:MAG: hypothetical protein ACOC8E_04600 [Planctomycetota bacterium]